SQNIVQDNYETLDYSREMILSLDQVRMDSSNAFQRFENQLHLQEENITEPGEGKATLALRSLFTEFRSRKGIDSLLQPIREQITRIMQLNLQAIDRKNQTAQKEAANARTTITVILTFCLLAGFTFLFNFPSLVASPIASLTEGIKAIAEKKYHKRIHLERKDEFGELANAFNLMAERLDQYEHSNLSRILFEKQRAEAVINSLKDASIGIDEKGLVLFANQQALHLLGIQESDIVGKMQQEVREKNDLFRFLLQEQPSLPFKIVVEGKENFFTREMVELPQEGKKPGLIIILKNITPFKELDTAKTQFMATISHELKTPLASSDFTLKLLEDDRTGPLNAEQLQLVANLKEDNRRILRILSELLDLSQVESGKIELTISPISAAEMIEEARMAILNTANQKNIRVDVSLAEDLPLVKADKEKAGWVLNNFLTNAIKYSPPDEHILISCRRDGDRVEIGVTDHGSGIEEGFQGRLFDRYYKVPGKNAVKGTGLGLAISKDLTEAMGGEIGVRSQLGQGSYFYFRLKVAEKA
ncbi:MAG: PAS domain-containing sensor histidine kinase, partial [Sphingobacteriales bacterium 12-47-4]